MSEPETANTPQSLSPTFVDAVAYATQIHLDQARKGSGVPYVGHLLGVCALVLEEGGAEDEAIAALLQMPARTRAARCDFATFASDTA
jgi:(p)ppGpp synthase/HD superfamily hydrolase